MNQSKHFNNVIKQNAIYVPSLLPKEYQQVDYLQSSGTQFLYIGAMSNYTYFDVDFELVSFLNNEFGKNYNFNGLLGINNITLNGSRVDTKISFSKTPRVGATVHSTSMGGSNISTGTKYNLYVSSDVAKLDGTTISSNTAGQIVGSTTCAVFAVTAQGAQTISTTSAVKIYRLKTNYVDLVPCYRKSDSKPGMYDINHDVFYTNQGTGEFTVGVNV